LTQHFANQPAVDILRQAISRQTMDGTGRYIRLGAGIGLLRSVMGRDLFVRTMRTLGKNVEPYLRPLNQCLVSDCYRGLSNLIHYADSRSMIHSVESRMPFMDYRLAEFTADVPANYKIHSGWTKYFARQAFDGKLPDSITWRRDKLGWPMPDQYWLSGPLRAWSDELVAGSSLVKELGGQGWSVTGSVHRIRQINLAQWERVFWTSSGRSA
jgi:asparagine synthase (glutamine-hydrolysing)